MNLKKPWQELHGSKKALRNGVYAALLTAVVLAQLPLADWVRCRVGRGA